MTDLAQPNFAPQDLDELQGLRALTFAFERMIANLDANEQNDNYNEQFNKIRAETKAIVNKYGYTINAPQAMLYGTLLQAMPFLKNDSRVQLWQALYDRAVQTLKLENDTRTIDRSATVQEV